MDFHRRHGRGILLFFMLGLGPLCWAQDQPSAPSTSSEQPGSTPINQQLPDPNATGSVRGTVTDRTGAVVAGALVKLTHEGRPEDNQAQSDGNGQFSFTNVAPGPFQLMISAAGFATGTSSGTLHPGENYTIPAITLDVATASTAVEVTRTAEEVATEEIKIQEEQRVLGVIPNFYVSYKPDAAPLNAKQKFKLAARLTVDPINFLLIGVVAGVQQAQNDFSGYGQGAEGYAKRYGASYADFAAGTFIGSAVLPSLLKQDPRYFYKGTGSKSSRALYAVANSVICKGDNGRWQPNYSNIGGNLAAGGISNLYYPASDRNGAALTIETGLIGIGTTAAANLLQEFVIKKLTPSARNQNPGN